MADPGASAGFSYDEYCDRHTVVLPRRRVLFLPMPKAGCTSMLWNLALAEGLTVDHFAESLLPKMTASATIHAVGRWPSSLRWSHLDDAARAEALSEDAGWFRFTLVREPMRRLFSAWQSKFLFRVPEYVKAYQEAPWFPRIPHSPEDVVSDFREFVLSLSEPDEEFGLDAHWAPQTSLIDSAPDLNHIGRLEQLAATLELLEPYLSSAERSSDFPRENQTIIPFHPGLIDDELRGIVARLYARDFEELGYEPPSSPAADLTSWKSDIAPLLPAVGLVVSRHERIDYLSSRARSLKRETERLQGQAHGGEEAPQGRSRLAGRRARDR